MIFRFKVQFTFNKIEITFTNDSYNNINLFRNPIWFKNKFNNKSCNFIQRITLNFNINLFSILLLSKLKTFVYSPDSISFPPICPPVKTITKLSYLILPLSHLYFIEVRNFACVNVHKLDIVKRSINLPRSVPSFSSVVINPRIKYYPRFDWFVRSYVCRDFHTHNSQAGQR